MLDANRTRRFDAVERLAVEQAGDGFVVAHAADPSRARRVAQCVAQLGAGVDLRRPAAQRTRCRGERQQVDVVIVQAGQQSAALGVDFPLVGAALKTAPDFGDETVAATHVQAANAIDFGGAHEQPAPGLRKGHRRWLNVDNVD